MSTPGAQQPSLNGRKLLFVDDRWIDRQSGLVRRLGAPVLHDANPVLRADHPWERDAAFVDSGLVIHDSEQGVFKCWYQGGACYGPDDGSNMCYATSHDGVVWDKPSLGMVDFQGSRANNMVLQAACMMHDPAIIIDPADPSPERRYKAIWWGGRGDRTSQTGWLLGHCVGFSPDGIRWTEHPENPVWPADAEVAVPFGIERRSGRHIMFSSIDGHGMRVVGLTESDDFTLWHLPPRLILSSDSEDPPGTELAGMAAVDYQGTLIGMLWVIRNLPGFTKEEWKGIVERNIRQGYLGPPIQMNAARCRLMYTELVTSVDGRSWQRVHRAPFLPMGQQGSWDECISLAGRPIVANNQIYIYYTGQGRTVPTPGTGQREIIGRWNVETGLATLRIDGFASLCSGVRPAELVTCPIEWPGDVLRLNADARNGKVLTELLDVQGRPIPEFTIDDALPIAEDGTAVACKWRSNSDPARLRGQSVKLRVVLESADLYSIFWGGV